MKVTKANRHGFRPLAALIALLLSSSTTATHSFTFNPASNTISPLQRRNNEPYGKVPKPLKRALIIRSGNSIPATAPEPGFLRKTFPKFPWHRVPDYLTYARCVAIPILMYTFYNTHNLLKHTSIINSSLFAAASFTDWLDGYLARRWQISTDFGAFLDPVADKLMVSTALILLSGKYGALLAIPSCIILAREIAVSALREWMAQKGLRDVVKVGYQGKVKTAGTMVALTVLLLEKKGFVWDLGVIMLYLSALVTVTSGSVYFKAAAPVFFEKETPEPLNES